MTPRPPHRTTLRNLLARPADAPPTRTLAIPADRPTAHDGA
ncbi:hypothetical protein [Actinomadura graeca]|nr:hypothetical protein [Actinomadura graeca]